MNKPPRGFPLRRRENRAWREFCWWTTVPVVSMNTAYMLIDLGHSVPEAPSGAHALRLLETDAQFDVVIAGNHAGAQHGQG